MRDPNRIPAILNELSVLWQKMPDMRLCQLLHYVQGEIAKHEHRDSNGDLFDLEDRLVLEALTEMNKEEAGDADDIEDDSSKLDERLKGD